MSKNKSQFFRPSKPHNHAASRPHIMLVVFTEEERRGWVNPHLTGVLMRFMADPRITVTYVPIHAVHPIDAARNKAVDDFFLKSDADLLVMVDNDVAPPQDVVDCLLGMPQECDIAILPYWVWNPQQMLTVPCFGTWEGGTMHIPDPETIVPGWQELGAGGTGFIAMRRRVFTSEKFRSPFFCIISDENRGQTMSEDIYFTGRATDAGFRVFLNADYVCSHFRTVDLAEVNVGIVRLLHRFVQKVQEKYGEIGVTVDSMVHELAPQLKPAVATVEHAVGKDYESLRAEATRQK